MDPEDKQHFLKSVGEGFPREVSSSGGRVGAFSPQDKVLNLSPGGVKEVLVFPTHGITYIRALANQHEVI